MVSFDQKVHTFIDQHELIQKGDRLLIGCSGGIDSMGLLHYLMDIRKKIEIEIFVAHVDHMLRGKVSLEDRIFVENFCKDNGITVFSTSIPIPKLLEEEGGNSQAVCRRERYGYFAKVMEENSIQKLVTAHHADDQLESILMSITKTGSLSGLKGMYAMRNFTFGTIVRPFLSVTKDEIREYLESKGGTYREDSSNAKDDYTRNRFRHNIIPLMKNENIHVPKNAVQLAQQLQEDDDYLFTLAKGEFPQVVTKVGDDSFLLDIPSLKKEPVSLQRRIILILLNYLYNNSEFSNSETIVRSIQNLSNTQQGNSTVHLPNQLVAHRKYSEILFEKMEDVNIHSVKLLHFNEWNDLESGICVYIGDASNVTKSKRLDCCLEYYCSSNNFKAPFCVRTRKDGDRIHLKGMESPKRLSRLFIDEKVPLKDRDHWPLLVDADDNIMAVIGIRENQNISKIQHAQDDIKIVIEYNNIYGKKIFN
ncbi:tRNA lysidine(34) synthetase TilS [Ureibacillus acetophenoni]|uniref:tRNA(Ile)-lysidine synthase n=1 Tax=Ureibacillus acetophenoni TaxID=614649 RepID=A0A285USK7_9BACL|nr:tRNA lysidine(34) synthetase TilS [Ureibacillus acetophenoni]SOC44830.1 tRNA(Ile)-lysidine synthase [Ureibacillus acetophenoni]